MCLSTKQRTFLSKHLWMRLLLAITFKMTKVCFSFCHLFQPCCFEPGVVVMNCHELPGKLAVSQKRQSSLEVNPGSPEVPWAKWKWEKISKPHLLYFLHWNLCYALQTYILTKFFFFFQKLDAFEGKPRYVTYDVHHLGDRKRNMGTVVWKIDLF